MKDMNEKKPFKLETMHWIIIAVASFVVVLSLILCLAFCGKDKGNEGGGSGDGGSSTSQTPGGSYGDEGFTGNEGSLDPNWDVNFD